MRQPFDKPPLSLKNQASHLLSKGILCDSLGDVERCLAGTGYYRFKTYMQVFLDDSQKFKPGTHLQDVIDLMEFDHELRLLSLEVLCKLEIPIRVKINEYLSERTCDPFWYLNRSYFGCTEQHDRFLDTVKEECRRSREGFIKGYNRVYEHPKFPSEDWRVDYPDLPPSWMMIEVCSFGTISRLYRNLLPPHAGALAVSFGVKKEVLANWLRVLSHLRNACAHHARLWNAPLSTTPLIPKKIAPSFPVELRHNRYAGAAAIIHYLINRLFPTNSWTPQLRRHLDSCPNWYLKPMGLSSGWYDHPFWN